MAVPITPIRLGDVVRLKKPHPCGANEWKITRLGADIKLNCLGCGRTVMLERYEFDRRFRGFVQRAADGDAADGDAADGDEADGEAAGGEAAEPVKGEEAL